METLTENEKAINALVNAAVNLDTYSLHYQVEMTPSEALRFVATAEDYNEATRERLEALINGINKLMPKKEYGEGNPNNGQMIHTFRLGREYSRVMYIYLVKTYRTDLSNVFYEALSGEIKTLAKQAKADEFTIEENRESAILFRLWWD